MVNIKLQTGYAKFNSNSIDLKLTNTELLQLSRYVRNEANIQIEKEAYKIKDRLALAFLEEVKIIEKNNIAFFSDKIYAIEERLKSIESVIAKGYSDIILEEDKK